MKPDEPEVDMSPEAIDRRLRMVEALRRLGVSLKEAGERARQQELQADAIPNGARSTGNQQYPFPSPNC